MKTLTIELINDYFIEVDPLNHTLKQRYTGKDEEGQEKECERTIGYFPNVQACLERLIRIAPIDETDKEVVSMKEYAECVENIFEKLKKWREDEHII